MTNKDVLYESKTWIKNISTPNTVIEKKVVVMVAY